MVDVCDLPVDSTVCHAASKAASSVVSAPFDWLAEGVGNAAEWMFKAVWQLFSSTTLVNVTEPNYLKVYDVLFGVAIFLMLLFFSLQLITGLIHRDPGALHRAAIGLAKSVLGCFLVVTIVGLALEITDELCVGIIQASGNTLAEMGGKIAALAAGIGAISVSAPAAGPVIIIFLGCLAITGAAIVWFSLLIRKSLLLVAVGLAPFALSGQSWDAARGWFSRWASFVVALIVSKLVVVVIFLVAINQMNAPIDLDLSSIANPVAGIVLMFIAAFAPYMAYKFISFIGFNLHHAMSAESEAKQAVNRPIPAPAVSRLGSVHKILGGGASGRGEDGGDGGTPGGPSAGGAADGPGGAGAAPGAGGGAAAGPLGLAAVAGAQALTSAGKAGPAAGRAVARSVEQHADAGQEVAGQASTQTPDGAGRTTPAAMPQRPSPAASASTPPPPVASEPPAGPAPNALPAAAPTVPSLAGPVDPNPGASAQHMQPPPARAPESDLSGAGS